MGCVLSYFKEGELKVPEGQLTDKLLEGDVNEEQSQTEPTKKDTAATTSLERDTQATEDGQSQDEVPDEPSDDDKALLLGALGATAAGAVTVGAVAGAVKAAQAREETRKVYEDQNKPLAEQAKDRDETSKITRDQRETPLSVLDRSELPIQDKNESPTTAPGAVSPDTRDEPPGDGGAAGLAVIAGASGAATAAVVTGAALQSADSTIPATADSDHPQTVDSETEEKRGESAEGEGKDDLVDLKAENKADEKTQIPLQEAEKGEDFVVVPSPEHSEHLQPNEFAKSPSGSADEFTSNGREQTPVQSQSALSASPDDSVFDDKQPQSQRQDPMDVPSLAEPRRSPSPVAESEGDTNAESGTLQSSDDTSGKESLIELLPEPPSTSPHSDREEDNSRDLSLVVASPVQVDMGQDEARIHASGEESIVQSATDKGLVPTEPSTELSGNESKTNDPVKERLIPITTADDSVVQIVALDGGLQTQSPAKADDNDAPTQVSEDCVHDQIETPLIHTTTIEGQSNTQTSAIEDDIHISSSAVLDDSDDQSKNVQDSFVPEQDSSAQPLTKEESHSPPAVTEEAPGAVSMALKDDDHIHVPGTDAAETKSSEPGDIVHDEAAAGSVRPSKTTEDDQRVPSSDSAEPGTIPDHSDVDSAANFGLAEKHDQSEVRGAVIAATLVDTAKHEPFNENAAREEVYTPKIVPAKRVIQQPSTEYEKFMSILVTPKDARQASVQQAITGDSPMDENTEQDKLPLKIDTDARSEDAGNILQKHEDEVESRAESTAEAVCGSATDLQEKIDSVQSPVPSVKEETVVKLDRFSIDSDAGSASAASGKNSVPVDVNSGSASSTSVIKDVKTPDDPTNVHTHSASETELPKDIDESESKLNVGALETTSHINLTSTVESSEDKLVQSKSLSAIPDDNKHQGLQHDLDTARTTDLRGSPTSAEPFEDSDMAHDASERTEDYDFDPLAKTTSFVFPDELAGRSSQLSEKPSSPFPALDDGDVPSTLATTEVKQTEEKATKDTQVITATTPETVGKSDANMDPPATEITTALNERVVSDEHNLTHAAEAKSAANERANNSLAEKAQMSPEAVEVHSEEKIADGEETTTAKSEVAAQKSEQVNVEEIASEAPTNSLQPTASEETDGAQQNPKLTEMPLPEAEQAATKIQAGVRGWQTRRKISRQQAAATQIQAGFRGWRVRRGRRMRRTSSLPVLSKTEPTASSDQYMDVDTLKDRAAAKIQAGFRGWRTRQEMKSLAAASPLEEAPQVSPAISMTEINAEEQAAARIQAGYRGWKTRRTLKRSLSDPNSEALVLAEGQQAKRAAEADAGTSGPQPAAIDDRLTTSVEMTTPRDEDETAHSIQSIQSEIAGSGESPRQDENVLTATSSTSDPASSAHRDDDHSKTDPPGNDGSTMEPSADSTSVGNLPQTDPSLVNPSDAPLSSVSERQQTEAAAKMQAGDREWETQQQMRTDSVDDAEATAVRPTVSAKSVTDSGALPIDFAIVHRPEDDWLTQDLMKIEAEKRAAGAETASGSKTDEKLVASAGDEVDGAEGKDARADSASTTESSSSWLQHAQTEIRASFQGLRDNVSDALKTVEDTARLVQEKGAGAEDGAESEAVVVADSSARVEESGSGVIHAVSEGPQGLVGEANVTLAAKKPDSQTGKEESEIGVSEKSQSEREEEEIWEEIQRSMRHED